jgi:DUSAM domain-containing protein
LAKKEEEIGTMPERGELEWEVVREIASRVESGEPLTLTEEVISELRRVAREVAISEGEIEAGLQSAEAAAPLLLEALRRMKEGNRRLGPALLRMYKLRDAGDLEGARQQMRDVLAVEVVPHYRNIAQGQLEQLDAWRGLKKKAPRKAPTKKKVREQTLTKKTPSTTTTKKAPRKPPRRKP